MAKVALIYSVATKHVLASFTTRAGDIDTKAPASDFVGKYLPIRDSVGTDPVVLFPSDPDKLKLAVVDLSAYDYAHILSEPLKFSVDDPASPTTAAKHSSVKPAVTKITPDVEFSLSAPPNQNLACAVAIQLGSAAAENPAEFLKGAMDGSKKDMTLSIDGQTHSYLLLVEGLAPVIA